MHPRQTAANKLLAEGQQVLAFFFCLVSMFVSSSMGSSPPVCTRPSHLPNARRHLTVIELSSRDHLTVTLHRQTGIYQISSESNHDPALSGHSTSQ